jgi:uncharacterized OB-fold protein
LSQNSSAGAAQSNYSLTDYPWDVEEYNKTSRFLTSLKKNSRIETTRCNRCDSLQWPPRSICSKCLSLDLSWIELSKKGELVAFSLSFVGLNSKEHPPIIVGTVELEGEGHLRLLARVVDAKYEELKVGMIVKLKETGIVDGSPYWTFAPSRMS